MDDFDYQDEDQIPGMDAQADLLRRQLAFANALRNQEAPRYSTGAGAALGGLGNILSALSGQRQARDAEEKLGMLAKLRATAVSPGQRLANAYKKAQLDKMQREDDEAEQKRAKLSGAPDGMQMEALKRLGFTNVPEGTTWEQAQGFLDTAEKTARLEQDSWGFGADPVTGGVILYNKKTGTVRPLGPGGGTPGPGPANPLIGKPTEKQRNEVMDARGNIGKLDLAIQTLRGNPGAYGGLRNTVAGAAEKLPLVGPVAQSVAERQLSQGELQAKNYVTNIVSAIINKRAGSSVTLNEELRQKFLPKETDGLDQVLRKLEDLKAMEELDYKAASGDEVKPSPSKSDEARKRMQSYYE